MLSGEQVAQLDAQPTVSTGPKEGSDFFGQLRERVAPGRSKNITPAEKFDFVDRLFNVTEPSPVTKGVYAGVLADEYESFLEVYPKVEATIKQALTAQSMFPGNPDYAKKFMEVAATKGIDPWQLKLHQAMTHHVSGEANWSNLTSDQRHDAYHTVFGKLMSDSNPDTKKEWVMTGMLVTKRHIEAIQIATGAQYMTNEPHVINRRSRNQVTSPFGGGVVEQERLFDSRSRGKRLKDLLRADYDGYKREMAGSRDDGLRKERDYYKSANNNKLYSRHQIDYDQGLDFDPTRPIGRKQLDAVQQEYVERYRRYYKSTDRVVDRGSHIEDQLIRLAAAQEDTHWAYFKEDLNTGNTLNLINRESVQNGPTIFVFNEAKTLRIQSGMESVGEIPKGHDIELGKRLDEVMNRVLDSQKPEVDKRERTALKPKISEQIKTLGERISPTDRKAQYSIANAVTPDSILSDARDAIIAIEKDSGVDFADSRQKEALETYIAEFLDSGKYDLIQNRSMNPNTLFRIDGIPTAAMEAVSYTSVLRPHVPPAYLEAMRVMVGDEVVETTPDGLALYDKFSKLITPNLFMKVYLSDSGRKSELEAVLGEPLQPEPTFFDSRFQRPDVRAIMMTSMGPDIANQILREMKAQAEAGILGKISPEASKRYQELSANRRTPDVIEVENSHTEANFESTVIGAKTKLVDKSKDQLAKVVPLEQFFTGKNLSPNQIKEIDIVVSTKRKALLNALSITTDGIVSISATDFNAQKASLLFLLRSVTNTTLSTTVLSDLDTYIVNETILNDLLNSSILFNHQRMSSEAKAVPALASEEVMKNRVERSQALIREFSILGKFDSTRESGHRVVDAKILQAIIFYNGGVGLDALEKAMVEMKLHNTSFSIAELLSSSSELYKLPFQPQEILDKILAKANAVRSVNSSLTVSSIYELNAGEVSKSIVLVAEDELGSVRGSQEIEALSFMMQSQEDYTRFARRDEVYDAQFWGVEGDDLTVALSTLPAIGTLSLAEELSAQIMARRKRKLTREN